MLPLTQLPGTILISRVHVPNADSGRRVGVEFLVAPGVPNKAQQVPTQDQACPGFKPHGFHANTDALVANDGTAEHIPLEGVGGRDI